MSRKVIVKNWNPSLMRVDTDAQFPDLVIDGSDDMQATDGYHSFDELYEHRITLFIALCWAYADWIKTEGDFGLKGRASWRSKKHSDGELCFGTGTQFVMGIGKDKGKQISYHIPIERWNETDFAETLECAPEFDGHSSKDVINRLKNL